MNAEKEKDLKFIREFSKISISQICRDLKINRPNVLNGNTTEKNIKKVKEEIIKRFFEIY